MVSVFVTGGSGVGKTTLIHAYLKKSKKKAAVLKETARRFMSENGISQEDLRDGNKFWDLQEGIAKLQLQLENQYDSENRFWISDRCLIDALVYAADLKPDKFPLLKTDGDNLAAINDDSHELFVPLFGKSPKLLHKVKLAIQRYRRSLVVLVHPFSTNIVNDGVRKVMTPEELEKYTECSKRVLRLLRIPFLDMKEVELSVRLSILQKALENHVLPSPLLSLSYSENISSKKVDRAALSRHFTDINIPFFLSVHNSDSIPCISFSRSELQLSFFNVPKGRIVRLFRVIDTSRLFSIGFTDDISAEDVEKILSDGLSIQGDIHHFLGCTSSGLKDRKCFLWKGTELEAFNLREDNGKFVALGSISKQIARFSLLLSSVVPSTVEPGIIIEEPDVIFGEANFTDGCGCISKDLATKVVDETRISLARKREKPDHFPSVLQIRYKGCKGVVSVNASLTPSTIVVRPSMKKFETSRFPQICLCDYSRPFTYGHLNLQFIMLLSGLGIPDSVFLDLQAEHFRYVKSMLYDEESALIMSEWQNTTDSLVSKTISMQCSAEADEPPFGHLRPLQKRLIAEVPKLKILVPESRSLFGIAEPPRFSDRNKERSQGRLHPGECLVRLTMRGNQKVSVRGLVLVSKNPGYLLGDIRILKAVSSLDRPDLVDLEDDLLDCIVFPIEGSRPHSNEIAGSDLDGDNYFVCWDKKLIPREQRKAYDYPAYSEQLSRRILSKNKQEKDMIRYFAGQHAVRRLTGRVDALFRAWADLRGVDSPECQRLGQLFSRVIDSGKSGETISIPAALEFPRDSRVKASPSSRFVWQRMQVQAENFVDHAMKEESMAGTLLLALGQQERESVLIEDQYFSFAEDTDSNEDFLLSFISRDHLGMSEFTKFRVVMQYFDNSLEDFMESEFWNHVNFAHFSSHECGFVIDMYDFPPILLSNALLCHSLLIGQRCNFLEKFGLEKDIPWKLFWRSVNSHDSVESTSLVLLNSIRKNTNVFLLLKVPDDVVIIIHFPREVPDDSRNVSLFDKGDSENAFVDLKIAEFMKVTAYFISGHFGYELKHSLEEKSYRMDISAEGVQLYRSKKAQTFIHLKKNLPNHSKKRAAPDIELNDDGLQVSVDLTRFDRQILSGQRRHPLVRKAPIIASEIFVFNRCSNYTGRISSFAYLDSLVENKDDLSLGLEVQARLKDFGYHDFDEDYAFKVVDIERPVEESLPALVTYLQKLHQQLCLCCAIPETLRDSLVDCVQYMGAEAEASPFDMKAWVEVYTNASALLVSLDIKIDFLLGNMPCDILQEDAKMLLQIFLSLVRRWDLWFVLTRMGCLDQFFLSWIRYTEASFSDNPYLHFIFRNTIEQINTLLGELKEGSNLSCTTAGVSVIDNLLLDSGVGNREVFAGIDTGENRSQLNMPTVTFYRVEPYAQRLQFTDGDFVAITRQVDDIKGTDQDYRLTHDGETWSSGDYDTNFPPLLIHSDTISHPLTAPKPKVLKKHSGYCFGRVVRICEAPFSISIKVVASSFGLNSAPQMLLDQKFAQNCYFVVSAIPANVITHTRNVDAIREMLEQNPVHPEIIPFLLTGESTSETEQTSPFQDGHKSNSDFGNNLNERQNDAIRNMLSDRVSLVQGPGGTGKTVTAVRMMLNILKMSSHRILVCAETNLAVDNLAERFLQESPEYYGPVRIGRGTDRNNPKVEDIYLEYLVHKRVKKPIRRAVPSFLPVRHKKIVAEILNDSRIVFATCAGTGDPLLKDQIFESVIMDEASMTTEPGALCALVHQCCHLVLIGDHKQLGPHAQGGICISLFERLMRQESQSLAKMTFLNVQHRMHSALCDFPSHAFYDGHLLTAPGMDHFNSTPITFFKGSNPVRFEDVPDGREKRLLSGSWFNVGEITRVQEIVELLLSGGELRPHQITVLTFYRAQQMKIRERLIMKRKEGLEVLSVDGCQGRENDIIVVSTVRSGSRLGFCDDKQRVNVLLTRARRGLIVVGNRSCLESSSLWSKWLHGLTDIN